MIDARTYGSSTRSSSRGISEGLWTSISSPVRVSTRYATFGRGHEQIEVELALEPLAHDLHVQEAEEAAAEAEAERLRRLRLVEERGVVELELLERVAELGVLVAVGREEAREDHRLHVLVPGERLGGRVAPRRQRVADAERRDVLQARDEIPDLARGEGRRRHHDGGQEAELLGLELRAGGHRAQPLSLRERPVDDAHERDDAAVLVVRGVEDERAGRRVGVARRRRHSLDDRIERVGDAFSGLRGDTQHALRRFAHELRDLRSHLVGPRLRQVDLVDGRDDLEVVLDGEVRVRERLRLAALRGVDHEQRALAGLQRARHLVREVDVPRRIDEVELMALPRDAHGLGLDRDASLPLELHRVEQLLPHLAAGDRVGQLEDAVGQRRLPVVDVGDDREVADFPLVHALRGAAASNQR